MTTVRSIPEDPRTSFGQRNLSTVMKDSFQLLSGDMLGIIWLWSLGIESSMYIKRLSTHLQRNRISRQYFSAIEFIRILKAINIKIIDIIYYSGQSYRMLLFPYIVAFFAVYGYCCTRNAGDGCDCGNDSFCCDDTDSNSIWVCEQKALGFGCIWEPQTCPDCLSNDNCPVWRSESRWFWDEKIAQ